MSERKRKPRAKRDIRIIGSMSHIESEEGYTEEHFRADEDYVDSIVDIPEWIEGMQQLNSGSILEVTKDASITVRLTDEEKTLLAAFAKQAGISQSDVVRIILKKNLFSPLMRKAAEAIENRTVKF